MYGNIYGSGVLLATKDDFFEYEIMWKDEHCNCGAEFEVGTSYRLRDNGPRDEKGYSPHSEKNANMSAVAYNKWYKRRWSLGPVDGKYIDKFVLSALGTPGRTVTAFFRYIRIVRGTERRRIIYDAESEPPNVSPYLPGSIVAKCQASVFLDGHDLRVETSRVGVPVQHNSSVFVMGPIVFRSIDETIPDHCPAFADWWSFFEIALEAPSVSGIWAYNITLRTGDNGFPLVVVAQQRFLYPQRTPLWFFHRFDLPERNVLSHLLETAIVQVDIESAPEWEVDSIVTVTVAQMPLFAGR